jgi:putative hemolysin
MDDGFLFELLLVAVLILLNGFFAGAEIAVISARRSRIEPLASTGHRSALALLRLKADPDAFLATVQIGVTVVGTLASAVGGVAAAERLEPFFGALGPWAARIAEPLAVGVVVVVIAFLSLVVGELLPKSLAVRHAEGLALFVARPIERLGRSARVLVALLTSATRILLRLLGQKGESPTPFHSLEDIRAILDEAGRQGVLDGDVVKGAVQFQDASVRQMLTPRSRVVSIPRGSSLAIALKIAAESGYSRLPVLSPDGGRGEGLVYARDLYEAERRGRVGDVQSLVRPTLLVPTSMRARALLLEMRRSRRHMALAVDEHGQFAGLVTLEDVFELIVGEIRDEHDDAEPAVRNVEADALEVDGGIAVRELNARHNLMLPESGEYVTVAGLLLDRLGVVPSGGETVTVDPYRLAVAAMAGRRIARVRIETQLG